MMRNLVRCNRSTDVRRFEHDLSRLLRSFFAWPPRAEDDWFFSRPGVNMFEDGDNLVVEVPVPGLRKEDLSLHLADDRLTIRGAAKQEAETKDRSYYRKEVRSGSFERTVALPYEVVADQAQAELKDGVLRIRLPKSPAAKSQFRNIDIKAT